MTYIDAPAYALWKYDPEKVRKLVKFLLSKQKWFVGKGVEGIVVSGTSGLVVAAALAANPRWKLPYIYVRKPSDISNSHGYRVEGVLSAKNVMFIDDLIASGDTLEHVKESLKVHNIIIKLCLLYQYLWYTEEPRLVPACSERAVSVYNIE